MSTPEFAFLQMGGLLTLHQLVLVGNRLCAEYRVREDGMVLPCEPSTTVERLKRFAESAGGCYGAKKVKRALRFVAGRARSPMEAKTAVLTALPVSAGGWGFGVPELNYRIEASELDSRTLDRESRKYFEIDLYWKRKEVGLEYDGADHVDPARVRADKRRINCLTANGKTILTVMYDQIADEGIRETLMWQLAKVLGVTVGKLSEEESEARNALMGDVFGSDFEL